MNMFEALMEAQRRLGKSPEYVADTEAKMKATPGMKEDLQSQVLPEGKEEAIVSWLVEEAKRLEASPTRLKALKLLNRASMLRHNRKN